MSRAGPPLTTYTVIFERGEDNWPAYVPDLPGCVAAAKAIALHLDLLRSDGDSIPEARTEAARVTITA